MAVISGLVLQLSAAAQSPRNLWLDSDNPAGIRQDTSRARVAFAEIYAGLSAGGFRASYDSPLPWNAGARSYALVHLKNMSMEGSFSFDQMQGDGMMGSMFVKPGRYPVDIYEFTPGRKSRQTYAFTGALSSDISEHWRLGLGIDFTSANYAKRKDLRHSNYYLDMKVFPGAVWHRDDLSLGLNLTIGKNSDNPKARQVGSKENYYAFLDKGLMYGSYELWDGSGIHLSDEGVNSFPVREVWGGLGLQLQKRDFYAALDYRYASGRAGEKQQIWFRFPSHGLHADIGDSWRRAGGLHSFRTELSWTTLDNNETVLEKYTEGGVTNYREIASNRILARQDASAEFRYSFEDGRNSVTASAGGFFRSEASTMMYPYLAERMMGIWHVGAAYSRVLGRFSVGASLGWGQGHLKDTMKNTSPETEVEGEPYRLSSWNERSMQHACAPRINAGIQARCRIWRGMYLRTDLNYTRAFHITVLPGADRFTGELAFGYEF